MIKTKKIFIACDTDNIKKVKKIIKCSQTNKLKIGYKFGLEFLNSKHGRNFISKLRNKIIFIDLKLNDIPNTIVSAMKSLKNGGYHFTSIGGSLLLKKKIESWSHQEFNIHLVKNRIEKNIINGRDIFYRFKAPKPKLISISFHPYSLIIFLSF